MQADLPGVVDDANEAGVNWHDGRYLSANIDYSTDAGTDVLVPSQGNAIDGGVNWISQDLVISVGLRKVGAYFNPVDGFNAHPDIAGYGLYAARLWQFAPQDTLRSIALNGMVDRYQGAAYGQSQSDNWLDLDCLPRVRGTCKFSRARTTGALGPCSSRSRKAPALGWPITAGR